jgi:hypothetical protein
MILFAYQYRVSKELCSPIYLYIFFMIIYTVIPNAYLRTDIDIVNISLANLNERISENIILHGVFLNISITILLNLVTKKTRYLLLSPPEASHISSLISLQYYLLYLPTLYLVYLYPWAEFGAERTIGNSFASYFKFYLTILFILHCAKYRSEKLKSVYGLALMFLSFSILFALDTARTPFLIGVVGVLYATSMDLKKAMRYLLFIALTFLILIYVTLRRSGIELSPQFAFWPFFSEGIFGSYSAFNAQAALENGLWEYSYPFRLIPDLIFTIAPKWISNSLEYKFVYDQLLDVANSIGVIDGRISPLGGYFFIADGLMYFGWGASFALAVYVISYLRICSRWKSNFRIYLYCSFFVMIKAPIWVVLTNGIFLILAAYLYKLSSIFIKRRIKD